MVGDEGLIENALTSLPYNDLNNSDFQTDAKSDACPSLSDLANQIDPGLGVVVEAWPLLHPSARLAVEAIVEASLQSVAIS